MGRPANTPGIIYFALNAEQCYTLCTCEHIFIRLDRPKCGNLVRVQNGRNVTTYTSAQGPCRSSTDLSLLLIILTRMGRRNNGTLTCPGHAVFVPDCSDWNNACMFAAAFVPKTAAMPLQAI